MFRNGLMLSALAVLLPVLSFAASQSGGGTGSGGTSTPPCGVTGSVQFSSTTAGQFGCDPTNFFFSTTTHRLGIDTNAPGAALDVNGNVFVRGPNLLAADNITLFSGGATPLKIGDTGTPEISIISTGGTGGPFVTALSPWTFSGSTVTITGTDASGYSLKVSSGVNSGGCFLFGNGTQQCSAATSVSGSSATLSAFTGPAEVYFRNPTVNVITSDPNFIFFNESGFTTLLNAPNAFANITAGSPTYAKLNNGFINFGPVAIDGATGLNSPDSDLSHTSLMMANSAAIELFQSNSSFRIEQHAGNFARFFTLGNAGANKGYQFVSGGANINLGTPFLTMDQTSGFFTGIGSHAGTPKATLDVDGTSTEGDEAHFNIDNNAIPQIVISTNTTISYHQLGSPITVGSGAGDCGTSPTVQAYSSNTAGRITVGSGANGGHCTITFSLSSWANPPSCFCNDETTNVALSSQNVGILTFQCAGTLVAGDSFNYYCVGMR